MTTATRRKADPSRRRNEARSATPNDQPGESPMRAPLITTHTLLRTHPGLFAGLDDSSFRVCAVARWDRLLKACDGLDSGVVLVDLDAAEGSHAVQRLGLSGHRLVTLLARQFAERPVALVVLTRLDYAEIEDLMREGVHALLHPGRESAWLLDEIRAAHARRQAQHQPRTPAPTAPTAVTRTPIRALVPIPPVPADAPAFLPPPAEPIHAFC